MNDTITLSDTVNLDDIVIDLVDSNTGNDSDSTYTLPWSHINLTGGATGATDTIWTSDFANTTIGPSHGNIDLRGDNADIIINGVSLKETLQGIQERLNMLAPNPEMEAEWHELRELGERYRELEARCREKSKMWQKLNSMPPPDIS